MRIFYLPMDYIKYESPGQWFEEAKKHNYSVPVQAGHLLSLTMEVYGISFPQAYEKLIEAKDLILIDQVYFIQIARINELVAVKKNLPIKK
jgi:hypothetical protein